MLKKFFLMVCGSFVGTFLALLFFTITTIIASFAIAGSMSSFSGGITKVEKNSILYLNLSGVLNERPQSDEMAMLSMMNMGGAEESQDLATIIKSLKIAKNHDNIKGIYIDCRGISAGMSSLYELRTALKDFKKSGKFVYAYGDEGIAQGDYFLASVADSIFLNPYGSVDVHGLASATPYMKKLLDKAGVTMQVVRVGTFKSAVEPYMLEEMSEANRLQQNHYLGSLWKEISKDMAKARNIDEAKFTQLTDSMLAVMTTKELLANKIIDDTCYRMDFEDNLRELTSVDLDEDLKLVSPAELVSGDKEKEKSNKIAVVYAVGEIDGSSSVPGMRSDGIDSEELVDVIRELQYDDDIKGMVLRVNSPGGSAFGSELIWKALDDFKRSGKTFAVSMGDYAASGGYYISSGAQRIFAEPLTITGSIGIFGMIPEASNLINNTLGVKVEEVATNKNSVVGTLYKPLTEQQRAAIQRVVEKGYDLFTRRCAMGRRVTQDSIKTIGEGRVWDAVTAKQIGLVDEFGGLDAAVKWVAAKLKLADGDYMVCNYPNMEMSFADVFGSMYSMKVENDMRSRMGMFYSYYLQLQAILGRDQVLCLMEPIEITL